MINVAVTSQQKCYKRKEINKTCLKSDSVWLPHALSVIEINAVLGMHKVKKIFRVLNYYMITVFNVYLKELNLLLVGKTSRLGVVMR